MKVRMMGELGQMKRGCCLDSSAVRARKGKGCYGRNKKVEESIP